MEEIKKHEVYGVFENQKGVQYMQDVVSDKIVAKKCTDCFAWKFLQDFNKAKKGFAGTHSLCRGCHNQNSAEYREEMKRTMDAEKEVMEQAYQEEQHYAEIREAHRIKRSVIF